MQRLCAGKGSPSHVNVSQIDGAGCDVWLLQPLSKMTLIYIFHCSIAAARRPLLGTLMYFIGLFFSYLGEAFLNGGIDHSYCVLWAVLTPQDCRCLSSAVIHGSCVSYSGALLHE